MARYLSPITLNPSDYATAAQGAKADTAVQNGGNAPTIRVLTRTEYDALLTIDPATIYILTD